MSRNTPKCMEDRMRKARLLQSVAIFAGSLALTLAPSDSRGQSAIDSGSQGYQTYGYGMQGSDAFDPEQLRGSEQRLYGAADQYGVARSVDPYGAQPWPQQAYDQPQGFPYPGQRIYGQGQGAFGGPAYGPYGPQGSRGFGQPAQQAYGEDGAGQFQGQQGWQPRGGPQDWQQRYGQQAMGGGFDGGMSRPFRQQSDFSQQAPRAAGQSDAERYRQYEALRHAYGQGVYGGYGDQSGRYDRYSAYQGAAGQFGQQPQSGMQGQFQQPWQGQPQYGMQGQFQQPWPGQPQYGMPGQFQQPWQGQPQYGMQGQFQQDGRFVQDRGQQLDRFGHPGGYPQFGRFDPGQMAYGQDQGGRMRQGHMMGQGMQGGMSYDQQPYGAARSGGAVQQQAGSDAVRIHVVSAGELVGRAVTDQSGQEIGTSRYLVIGAQSGRVHFVMVGSGASDQLDLGTDLLPVPWRVIDAGQDQRIALSIPTDRLRELPRVAPSELASVTGPQLVGRISQLITMSPDESGSADQGTTAGQPGQQSGTQQQATTDTSQSGQSSTSGSATQQDQAGTTGTSQSGTAGVTGTDQSQQAQAGGQQSTQGGSRDQIASADLEAGLGGGQEDVVVLGGRYGALVAPPNLMTEGELTGTSVFSADGMPIGDIDEILIDERRGQVAYVLVSIGGFLGTDQRWLPVPFTAMTWMPTRMGFALQIQSSQMATLPALAQGTPPRFIRGRDLANLYYAYGAEPYWLRPEAGGPAGLGEDRG
jgi:sporulation protein YlmC with PRC-barrel domain